MVEKTSNIEYLSEMKDILHTDHCGVACTIRIEGNALVESKDRRERREKAGKGGYGIVGRVRSEQFWAWLEEESDKCMDEVNERIKKGKEDVEQGWEALKQGLTGILNEGKREAKRMNKKRKEGREIEDKRKN